jgi:hypothetical protein
VLAAVPPDVSATGVRNPFDNAGGAARVRSVPIRKSPTPLFVHDVSALRSVCASAISGNSGVGEKPFSADASTAWAPARRSVE